jgi:predicted DCC family thiol-disulfide oxidoreductase YuxK
LRLIQLVSKRIKGEELRVLIDGQCPFCRLEARWLSRIDRNGKLSFEDINSSTCELEKYGLAHEQVMGRIHGILPDGTVIDGLEVFRQAYRAVGLGWLIAPATLPVLKQIFEAAYRVFARYRVPLGRLFGRSCPDDSCSISEN